MITDTKHPVGDPAALGLLGLAIVTLVAASEKLGWTSGTALVLPWALFLGAGAQLLAGILDFRRHNVFGGTAFSAYALFWFAVAMTWLIRAGLFGPTLAAQADTRQLGIVMIGYLLFTLYMTAGSLVTHKVLIMIFVVIDVLFVALALNAFGIAPQVTMALAGAAELVVSLLSFYGSAATMLNHQYGRALLPVGRPVVAPAA